MVVVVLVQSQRRQCVQGLGHDLEVAVRVVVRCAILDIGLVQEGPLWESEDLGHDPVQERIEVVPVVGLGVGQVVVLAGPRAVHKYYPSEEGVGFEYR